MPPTDPPANSGAGTPRRVLHDAQGAYARRAGASLAVLVSDSLLDRGDPPDRHRLLFGYREFSWEAVVSVTRAQIGVCAVGPGEVAELVYFDGHRESRHGSIEGCFSFPGLSHGIVRLSFRESIDSWTVKTDWFQI